MTRSQLEREAGLRSCCRRGQYRPTTQAREKGLGALPENGTAPGT
jgi:hypothetical protein